MKGLDVLLEAAQRWNDSEMPQLLLPWSFIHFVALIVCPFVNFFALLIHINAHFADLTNNAERTGFVYRLV